MLASVLLLLLSFSTASLCDFFVFPTASGPGQDYTANPVFTLGSKQTLQWSTTMEVYNIQLWQQDLVYNGAKSSQSYLFSKRTGDAPRGSFDWIVAIPPDINLDSSPVFFLGANFSTNPTTQSAFTSHYFNITKASATSPSPSATPSSPSSSSASTSGASTASLAPAKDTGLSSGTKAGLGVGIGIGVPIILLLAFLVRLRATRERRQQPYQAPTTFSAYLPAGADTSSKYMSGSVHDNQIYEAESAGHLPYVHRSPTELDTSMPRTRP